MSMMEWAKREVEIASKRERGDKPESEWDYGCACYDSALKAFESLCGDGHSGFSIGITKEKEWGWKKDPYIYPRSFYSPVGYTPWDPWGRRL